MKVLFSKDFSTEHGVKTISVVVEDVLRLQSKVDILTTSAFSRAYYPSKGTVFGALASAGVSVKELSQEPEIDLREPCNVWLSKELGQQDLPFERIGCVETRYIENVIDESFLLQSIRAYFQMLDIASTVGVKISVVALPLLGAGLQGMYGEVSSDLSVPIIRECVSFLKRNADAREILFVDIKENHAKQYAETLENSYALSEYSRKSGNETGCTSETPALVFISYSSQDRNVADNLCFKLESRGMKVWYSPRNVRGDYATAITEAIEQCTHFVVILSENSMRSEHVLNEVDLAFGRLSDHVKIYPLRIDKTDLASAFKYYLSRQHWMDAILPPLEQRLEEFAEFVREG